MWKRNAVKKELEMAKIKLDVSKLMFYDVENIRNRIYGIHIDIWMLGKYKEVLQDMRFRAISLFDRAYDMDTISIPGEK